MFPSWGEKRVLPIRKSQTILMTYSRMAREVNVPVLEGGWLFLIYLERFKDVFSSTLLLVV